MLAIISKTLASGELSGDFGEALAVAQRRREVFWRRAVATVAACDRQRTLWLAAECCEVVGQFRIRIRQAENHHPMMQQRRMKWRNGRFLTALLCSRTDEHAHVRDRCVCEVFIPDFGFQSKCHGLAVLV
jgi:hypothetical protein